MILELGNVINHRLANQLRTGRVFLRFSTSGPRLLALAKQAFPGDPMFQPIKPPKNRFE